MEILNVSALNLNKICRVCLCEYDNMKNMHERPSESTNLLEMFVSLLNCEVRVPVDVSPQICGQCEEKLNASYKFREQCLKSDEILARYSENSSAIIAAEPIKVEAIDEDDDWDNSEGETSSNKQTKHCRNSKDRNVKQQTTRLMQVSVEKVSEAIEESRRKFFENTMCGRCGFIGSNLRALSVHMSHLHKELKGRWCMQCNAEFDNLPEHSKIHEEENLKCRFCGKIFQAKGHLTEHLRSHAGVRPYVCDACGKSFLSQRHLKVHFRIHTNERPYKCNLCSKTFIQYNSLKHHCKQHEKIGDKYICNTCNLNFLNKLMLDEHLCTKVEVKDEMEDGAYASAEPQNFCTKCDKKVRSLVVHNRQSHLDDNTIYNDYGDNVLLNSKLCTVCGKQFKTSTKLRVHMRVHTGEAPYKCGYCDKRVSTRNQLVVHERIHTGERPHVCHVCGKGFAQSSVLNTHMRIHTGRPEVCKICEQRFCRPAELKLHMRKHTGEKPYLCTECGQAFIQRSHLVEHNKTHSDLRPFQCTYCDKAFKQNSSLKTHIQIHLGHKPFKCSQCPYACRQSYSLTQHMKQHVVDAPRPDRPHLCPICNKSFSTVAMLTSHANCLHRGVNSNPLE